MVVELAEEDFVGWERRGEKVMDFLFRVAEFLQRDEMVGWAEGDEERDGVLFLYVLRVQSYFAWAV